MHPLADVSALEVRLGRTLEGAEASRAVALLDDASALVRDVAGKDWIDPDTGVLLPVPGTVRATVLRMVDRAVRNPDGFSAESAGDYSYQRTGVQPGIYLTDPEEKAIRRALGKSGLWNQPVTRNEEWYTTVWVNDQFGTEPIPYDIYRD
jgi:Gp19/Gp15/Gp42-like protein